MACLSLFLFVGDGDAPLLVCGNDGSFFVVKGAGSGLLLACGGVDASIDL